MCNCAWALHPKQESCLPSLMPGGPHGSTQQRGGLRPCTDCATNAAVAGHVRSMSLHTCVPNGHIRRRAVTWTTHCHQATATYLFPLTCQHPTHSGFADDCSPLGGGLAPPVCCARGCALPRHRAYGRSTAVVLFEREAAGCRLAPGQRGGRRAARVNPGSAVPGARWQQQRPARDVPGDPGCQDHDAHGHANHRRQ